MEKSLGKALAFCLQGLVGMHARTPSLSLAPFSFLCAE